MNKTDNKIIYDIGANSGMNIPYYIKKSDFTVAVEANPLLASKIRANFASEIDNGNLSVENCIVSEESEDDEGYFYVHKNNSVLSQFIPPDDRRKYDRLCLPAFSIEEIFRKYGSPYYVKIDIEHYDHIVLRAIFESGTYPNYISSEAHEVESFETMISEDKYDEFKIVEGRSVSREYKEHIISTQKGIEQYSFPHHSAGPFGEDLRGSWMDSSELLSHLSREGTGWKDIHARRCISQKN